ncbi:hypothetical protein, partial [Klebsiella aerogenes]|uniref:hypothetical protein n=1 Tax=Klebsiella aerogenes TaxID=548 RepID=UPI0019547921
IPSHAAWESTLLDIGYEFAYFDGLNRYYVSVDHLELRERFGPGPNLFDGFRLVDTSSFVDTSRLRAAISERDAELS